MAVVTKRLTAQQIADQAEAMVLPKVTHLLPMVADIDLPLTRRKILVTKNLQQAARWSQKQKVEYAGVSRKTWYNAEHDSKFREICTKFIDERMGANASEFWGRYCELALGGDRQALERILQQLGILDKPEKGGDTNIALTVTVEEAKKLDKERQESTRIFVEQCGYALLSDN